MIFCPMPGPHNHLRATHLLHQVWGKLNSLNPRLRHLESVFTNKVLPSPGIQLGGNAHSEQANEQLLMYHPADNPLPNFGQ